MRSNCYHRLKKWYDECESDSTKVEKKFKGVPVLFPPSLLESQHIQMHHKVKVSKGNDVNAMITRVQKFEITKQKNNSATENVTILSESQERKNSVNEVQVIARVRRTTRAAPMGD